jgi:hypothetical protein
MISIVFFKLFFKGFQKWIGYDDVKSVPTYFSVQRDTSFSSINTPITFQVERTNTGGAMNLATGKFTAPRVGTYFFSYTGIFDFPTSSSLIQPVVRIFVNGNFIGSIAHDEANSIYLQSSPFNLQSTLNLQQGDQVWLQYENDAVTLYDSSSHYQHFTGWLLEEDISKSL